MDTIALRNVRVFNGHRLLEPATVVIDGDRIGEGADYSVLLAEEAGVDVLTHAPAAPASPPYGRADLVLIDGDPVADIRSLSNIAAVWCGGARTQEAR